MLHIVYVGKVYADEITEIILIISQIRVSLVFIYTVCSLPSGPYTEYKHFLFITTHFNLFSVHFY